MVAISYPIDLIDTKLMWTRSFTLRVRQEFSRIAGGGTIRKELGTPIWYAEYTTRILLPSELDALRAKIDLLEGGIGTFRGLKPSRCRPIAYPISKPWFNLGDDENPVPFDGNGFVSFVYPDNKRIDISGLPQGYIVSAGDLIQIGANDLYSVVRGGVASSGGVASEIEFRPTLWPSSTAGSVVKLLRPTCLMCVDPNETTIEEEPSTGRGTISFTAIEVRT